MTKGDANAVRDAWRVRAEGSGWRVVGSVPYGGYVVEALRSPIPRLVAFALVFFWIGSAGVRWIWARDGVTQGERETLAALLALCVALVGAVAAAGSEATFAAQTANRGTCSRSRRLYAPSGLSATVSGHDVSLSWTAGTNGSGYKVYGVANGTNSNCSGATVSQIGTSAATTYADTGRYTPQGNWFCYEVRTSYASAWTSVNSNPTVGARIGFFASSVAVSNGGTAGRLDAGDVVVANFNQAVTTSTGPERDEHRLRGRNGQILLGSTTTAGACATSETVQPRHADRRHRSRQRPLQRDVRLEQRQQDALGHHRRAHVGNDDDHHRRHADVQPGDGRHEAPVGDRRLPHLRYERRRRRLPPDRLGVLLSPGKRLR